MICDREVGRRAPLPQSMGSGWPALTLFNARDRGDLRQKPFDETDLAWDGIEFVGQRDIKVDGSVPSKPGSM